ncbi:acyl carrier protein [Myroides odoratus]|uniref:acyl carrier protein n=1 Tax=Myroides odoratus TaxID=256 RepID=UPI003341454B
MNDNEIILILQEIVNPFIEKGKIISINDELADDLGLDSIDVVDLVVFIEDKFSIVLEEEELDSLKSISNLVELIKNKSFKI